MQSYRIRVPTTAVDEFATNINRARRGQDAPPLYHSAKLDVADHFCVAERGLDVENIEYFLEGFCDKNPEYSIPSHSYREYEFSPDPFSETVKAPNILSCTLLHKHLMKDVPSFMQPVVTSTYCMLYVCLSPREVIVALPEAYSTKAQRESFTGFKARFESDVDL